MDKRSCDNLLNAILEDKREDDVKKRTIKNEMQLERNRLMNKHNKRMEASESLGIKHKNSSIVTARDTPFNEADISAMMGGSLGPEGTITQ